MQRLFCVLISAFFFCNASAQKDSLEATITGFFDGLSELNETELKGHTTADFLLLENGAVWNMDTLLLKISPLKNMNVKRVNSFSFISSHQKGDVAWISYHNTANYTAGDKQQTRDWLESAVLVKQAGRWKIQLLHSTRKH